MSDIPDGIDAEAVVRLVRERHLLKKLTTLDPDRHTFTATFEYGHREMLEEIAELKGISVDEAFERIFRMAVSLITDEALSADEPFIEELTDEDILFEIDREARRRLGMSGDEFIDKYLRGEMPCSHSAAAAELGFLVRCLSDSAIAACQQRSE